MLFVLNWAWIGLVRQAVPWTGKKPDVKGLGVEKTRLRVVKSHDS
jgi:hypothetical protein